MESLPRLSGGRALSSDILCRNSEEPECGGGCYPTKHPGTIQLPRLRRDQKAVRVQGSNYGQVRVSGYKIWQDLSERQGFAKTMMSPLIIPSVSCKELNYFMIFAKTMQ
jgi:hypothetical protein